MIDRPDGFGLFSLLEKKKCTITFRPDPRCIALIRGCVNEEAGTNSERFHLSCSMTLTMNSKPHRYANPQAQNVHQHPVNDYSPSSNLSRPPLPRFILSPIPISPACRLRLCTKSPLPPYLAPFSLAFSSFSRSTRSCSSATLRRAARELSISDADDCMAASLAARSSADIFGVGRPFRAGNDLL